MEANFFTKTLGKRRLVEVIDRDISQGHKGHFQVQGQGQEQFQGHVQNKVKYQIIVRFEG